MIIAKAMKLTGLKDKLFAQSAEATLHAFEDAAAVASWAKNGVADTVQAGIASGRNADTLAPQGYMTRAEVATMIQRLLKQSGLIHIFPFSSSYQVLVKLAPLIAKALNLRTDAYFEI